MTIPSSRKIVRIDGSSWKEMPPGCIANDCKNRKMIMKTRPMFVNRWSRSHATPSWLCSCFFIFSKIGMNDCVLSVRLIRMIVMIRMMATSASMKWFAARFVHFPTAKRIAMYVMYMALAVRMYVFLVDCISCVIGSCLLGCVLV